MRYCFDLDDTISVHRDRDYPNARPIQGVIDNIRRLKDADPDAYIIIHTARGMHSCNGDIGLADRRNRQTIKEWLGRYNVPYDEIIFGKPLADAYIDDKAISAKDFALSGAERLNGFSGANVLRIGNMIVKDGDRTRYEYEWYKEDSRHGFQFHKTPQVLSYTLGKLYLEYIRGNVLANVLYEATRVKAIKLLYKVRDVLNEYRLCSYGTENDIQQYITHIQERASYIGVDVKEISEQLANMGVLKTATHCHGDFSALNIIINDGALYLIDPCHSSINTWYLDAAKMRASLRGLDAALRHKQCKTTYLVQVFDSFFSCDDVRVIKMLEKTHYIRVMYYAKKSGQEDIYNNLKNLFLL